MELIETARNVNKKFPLGPVMKCFFASWPSRSVEQPQNGHPRTKPDFLTASLSLSDKSAFFLFFHVHLSPCVARGSGRFLKWYTQLTLLSSVQFICYTQGVTSCWKSVHGITGYQPDIRGVINGYQHKTDQILIKYVTDFGKTLKNISWIYH